MDLLFKILNVIFVPWMLFLMKWLKDTQEELRTIGERIAHIEGTLQTRRKDD